MKAALLNRHGHAEASGGGDSSRKHDDIRKSAETLGVTTVLEGSVGRAD